jgi:hypothetical protein
LVIWLVVLGLVRGGIQLDHCIACMIFAVLFWILKQSILTWSVKLAQFYFRLQCLFWHFQIFIQIFYFILGNLYMTWSRRKCVDYCTSRNANVWEMLCLIYIEIKWSRILHHMKNFQYMYSARNNRVCCAPSDSILGIY